MRVRPGFEVRDHGWSVYRDKRDWWVGWYRGDTHNYVCLLPTIVIRWPRRVRDTKPL